MSWRKLFSEWSTDVLETSGECDQTAMWFCSVHSRRHDRRVETAMAPKPEECDEEKSWAGWMQCAKPAFESREFPEKAVLRRTGSPVEQQFDRAISKSRGAAGLDGWSATEVKALFRNLSWPTREIYLLWCDTTRKLLESAIEVGNCLVQHLEDLLFSWRTVGIPKKDDTSRPIGVVKLSGQSMVVRVCSESSPAPPFAMGWKEANGCGSSDSTLAVSVFGAVCGR